MTTATMHRLKAAVAVVFGCAVLVACGTAVAHYAAIEKNLWSGNYAAAAAQIEKSQKEYGNKGVVLYNLELGTAYHYAGMYDPSTRNFLTAERKMQDLWTVSVSTEASALLLNDNALDYGGEDHEKVLVNFFAGMNFAEKGDYESALVEARKVDTKLKEISRLYDGKNRYQEDAFVRYVAGVLYEADNEMNDAFISYRKAAETYEGSFKKTFGMVMPGQLKDDLIRSADAMNFREERDQYRQKYGKQGRAYSKSEGSVFAVIYSGKSPVKVENNFEARLQDLQGMYHSVKVSVPKYMDREARIRSYTVMLTPEGGGSPLTGRAEVAEDIGEIAKKALEDRLTILYLKSGGRAILKFIAKEQANKEIKKQTGGGFAGELLSFATSAAVDATEAADIRTWRTLPDNIQVSRIYAPPGRYTLTVSEAGRIVASKPVTVKAGGVEVAALPDVN